MDVLLHTFCTSTQDAGDFSVSLFCRTIPRRMGQRYRCEELDWTPEMVWIHWTAEQYQSSEGNPPAIYILAEIHVSAN